jgi:hypothetical protein
MKHALMIFIAPLLATMVAACSPSEGGAATDSAPGKPGTAHRGAPQRKDGWWEFASVTSTGRSLGTQGLCVSKDTEAVFSAFDQITQELLIGTRCSKANFHPAAGGFEFDTACDTGIPADLGGGIVTSKGNITGDVATRYSIDMTVTQAGETNHGRITAAWKGACPTPRKPGDLTVDGEMRLNILNGP